MVALLSWVNHVDDAATILSASDSEGDLSISNVADSIIGRRWRATATSWGQADFGSNKTIDIVCLVYPRDSTVPTSGTIQHQFDASGGTPGAGAAHDSGAIAHDVSDGYGYHVYKPSAAITARYWRFTFSTAPTAVNIGRAWAGEIFQPTLDIAFGIGDEWEDLSRVSAAARSGAEYVDERSRRRLFTFALNALSTAERDSIREMGRLVGTSKQLLFVKDPAAPTKETVIGRFAQTTPLLRPQPASVALYAKLFKIRESI